MSIVNGPWSARRRTKAINRRFLGLVAVLCILTFAAALRIQLPPISLPGALPSAPAQADITEPGDTTAHLIHCQVDSISDGDTLRCKDGVRIRLHAVAARESDETCSPGHPCPAATAAAAKRELLRLAGGKTLVCEPSGRSYERITAICWTQAGEEVNCAMIRSGTAVIWEEFNRQRPLCDVKLG